MKYKDLQPGDVFSIHSDNGAVYHIKTDRPWSVILESGILTAFHDDNTVFKVKGMLLGTQSIPPDTIDKPDPNLSNVSDKPALSVENLVGFIDWLDRYPGASFSCWDGMIVKLAERYLAERNNSRKVPENDTFRK